MTLKKQANIETATRVAFRFLSSLRQSTSGCFLVQLSGVETSSVSGRQMTQPYWRLWLFSCIWRKALKTKVFGYFFNYKYVQHFMRNYFNVSLKVTNLIAFLCRVESTYVFRHANGF